MNQLTVVVSGIVSQVGRAAAAEAARAGSQSETGPLYSLRGEPALVFIVIIIIQRATTFSGQEDRLAGQGRHALSHAVQFLPWR